MDSEKMKEVIEEQKAVKAKAEGGMENIEKVLKEKHNITIDSIEKEIDDLAVIIADLENKFDKKFNELDKIVDWDELS